MSPRPVRQAPVTLPEHVPAAPALPEEPRARLLAVVPLPLPIPELTRLAQEYPGATIREGRGGLWVMSPGRDCGCMTCWHALAEECRALTGDAPWPTFIVCPDCGNKRCPRAAHHGNACTRSNEPGQPGSAYPLPAGEGPLPGERSRRRGITYPYAQEHP